jgi:hypothetical protein
LVHTLVFAFASKAGRISSEAEASLVTDRRKSIE